MWKYDIPEDVSVVFHQAMTAKMSNGVGFVNRDFEWKQENRTPNVHNFSAVSDVTANIQDLTRREIFELVFNEELVRKIITETNKLLRSTAGSYLVSFIATDEMCESTCQT